MSDQPTTVEDELAAIRRIVAVIEKLDPAARERVFNWLGDRYRPDHEEEA